MALTNKERAKLRNACEKEVKVDYTTPDIDAAMQAMETLLTSPAIMSKVSTAIDNAGTFSFSAAQKKSMFKNWLFSRFGRE